MFRKGGSAGEGITSGLAPRQNYEEAGDVKKNDLSKIDLRNMNMQQIKDLADQMSYKPEPMSPDNSLRDFKIDFGLDLVSRPPGGNIFQTAASAAKDPFQRFKDSRAAYTKAQNDRSVNKYNSQTGMFETLLGAQSDIFSSEGSGKSYEKIAIAQKLKQILPRFLELKDKRRDSTQTLTKEEELELRQLQEDYNIYRKKDIGEDLIVDIFVKGQGERYLPNKIDTLYKADLRLGAERKYNCLLYTSPSPRDGLLSRMPSSA